MEYERCSELEDHRSLSLFNQADEARAMREMGGEDLFRQAQWEDEHLDTQAGG